MPFMIEYTLFTTLAFHHLTIGMLLFGTLVLANKLIAQNAELKSWLWMSAFIVATLTPFSLINWDNVNQNTNAPSDVSFTSISRVPQDTEQAINPIIAKVHEQRFWHLPTSIVFNYSFLLTIGLAVWLVGSCWRTYIVYGMWFRTQKLIKRKGQLSEGLSQYIGIPVYVSESVASPMVIAYSSPWILLPNTIVETLNQAQVQAILQHEKAHISRKDNWFGLFQEIIAIVFWWSPIMRLMNRQIHVQREMACDLRAAQQCENNKQYAQSLLDCAKLMVHQHRSVLAMGLFSKKKELQQRIGLVLQSTSKRKLHNGLIVLICAVFSILTIQVAQAVAPKISIKQTALDARHYSILPVNEGQLLIQAVAENNIDSIIQLQSQGVDINTPVIGDGTALMIAVKLNNMNMVNALIDLGADPNQSSRYDGNPLIVAAARNNVDIARVLLDRGAYVDAIVPDDETALINASYYGHMQMTVLLLERGADINLAVKTSAHDGNEIRTPLNRARNNELRELLLRRGAEG